MTAGLGRRLAALLSVLAIVLVALCGCQALLPQGQDPSLGEIPAYDGQPYVTIADNQPAFTLDDFTITNYEHGPSLGKIPIAE